MRLYMARHGQTDLNAQQRFQGTSDPPLNAEGIAQAEALALRLPPGLTRIVASPLRRAHQTAAIVAARHGLPVLLMEGFRERAYGVFEGLCREEIEARYPELWARRIARHWDDGPPGGETMRAAVERVRAALDALAAEHAGETVLLVAHGFVARAVHLLLRELPPEAFYDAPMIGNAEFEFFDALPPGGPPR
ncbi:histidine phosphatase family protein [Derxia gummosa]|uniref:Histidine phosphatase family protein n=1 Tax=Derxia gummosa DSM 723 TaxID=1121388 RepID=A0A8B6X8U5_9BURK|nr:histidine phosphatase family protein [Derxia gummosa]